MVAPGMDWVCPLAPGEVRESVALPPHGSFVGIRATCECVEHVVSCDLHDTLYVIREEELSESGSGKGVLCLAWRA